LEPSGQFRPQETWRSQEVINRGPRAADSTHSTMRINSIEGSHSVKVTRQLQLHHSYLDCTLLAPHTPHPEAGHATRHPSRSHSEHGRCGHVRCRRTTKRGFTLRRTPNRAWTGRVMQWPRETP
jgi:hypothetical protein